MPQGVSLSTPARSQVSIVVEAEPGENVVVFQQPVTSTISLPSQPSGGVSGYRVHVQLMNNTTTGTIIIGGVDLSGNALTPETTPVPLPPPQRLQSSQIGRKDYVTETVFGGSITVTTTGCANGVITVGYIQAAKILTPLTLKSGNKTSNYSPNEATGQIEKDTKVLQGSREVPIDSMDQDLYVNNSLWWALMLLGQPTSVITVPTLPTALLPATTIASSMTLNTQPLLPGQQLIITITSFSAGGTITFAGVNRYNQSAIELLNITGNGTYYTTNNYANVFAISGSSGLAGTIAIGGVYGWQYTFNSSGAQQTLTIEHFDGSGSYTMPYSYLTEGDFDVDVKNNAKLTSKGMSRDKLPIGDRTITPLATNRTVALPIPLELPAMGWQSLIWIDPISGTPGTTLQNVYSTFKLSVKAPVEAKYNLTNQQAFTRAFSGKREATVELMQDLFDLIQFEEFRTNSKQYLVYNLFGENIGTVGTTAYYKGWNWTLPVKYDGDYSPDSEVSKVSVEQTNKMRCEYDAGIGASYLLVITCTQPPTYAL